MAENIYERLRKHLDSLPTGFPSTRSGVELRILKKLFTEEEAGIACGLLPVPETAEQIAARLGGNAKELSDLLYGMSRKGLILRVKNKDVYQYMAIMFVVGIMEFQVNRLDRELAEMLEEYNREGFSQELVRPGTPQLRVVPVQESISPSMEVQPYDELRKILESQRTIVVADCICRKKSALLGHPCSKPLETCFFFGGMGEFYLENQFGRKVSLEEALKILQMSEEAGLVPSPANAQKSRGMCLCCGCCCGILNALKLHPHPSSMVKSNYFAQVNQELCSGCETCLQRCQMGAVYMDDDWAAVDLKRCIGCGLCVTTCPSQAVTLKAKERKEHYVPPLRGMDTYMQIARERGKFK